MTTPTVPPSRPSRSDPDINPVEQTPPAAPAPRAMRPTSSRPSSVRAAPGAPPAGDDRARRFLWQGRIAPAFWTITGLLSLAVNVILIVIILLLAGQLFRIKELVGDQLIGGLYENFVKMDQAHIRTTITVSDTIMVNDTIFVNDTIPVVFTLPLKQNTAVILTRDTPIRQATVYLNGSPVPTDLVLRQGTKLNIALDLEVPVNQTVPVNLTVPVSLKVPVVLKVPVDIPLAETELHEPFVGLQQVIGPYHSLMQSLPGSWAEVLCGPLPDRFCE